MSKRSLYLILILSVFHVFSLSGQEIGSCGEILLNKQERKTQKEAFLRWKIRRISRSSTSDMATIPVVFHFIDNDAPPSIVALESVMEEVNRGFANLAEYETVYGIDSKIRFCLAKSTPDGGVSNGLNVINSRYEDFDFDLELGEFLQNISWDNSRYLNVWVANFIRTEHPLLTLYSGKNGWSRPPLPGFAIAGRGVVVTSINAGLLIHEFGHYLGLLHPFEGFLSDPCKNDDCLLDGDMVCDTPPDRSVGSSCGNNSCDTDTLSNYSNPIFFKDTLDMGSNFMDYGGCPIEFSHGQIDRMRFVIDGRYSNLPIENSEVNVCEKPCELDAVGIHIDTDHIIAGQQVGFTSTGGILDNHEWYIFPYVDSWHEEPLPSSLTATSESIQYTFSDQGWYTIYVKAWNDLSTCFTSFSRNVMVTCGVDARFSPDKRKVASKQPNSLFTDSVMFVNYSKGANNYEWSVKFTGPNGESPFPEFKSTDVDLTYFLSEPGTYGVQLSATNGSCTDISNTLFLSIIDPTMDGSPTINDVSCINEDSILVKVTLYNYGFDTINAGIPISFYDGNPQKNSGASLLETKELPSRVLGFEEIEGYSKDTFDFYVQANYTKLDSIFIVFNDLGFDVFPIDFPPGDKDVLSSNSQFPPSGRTELDYGNNFGSFVIPESVLYEDIDACLGEELIFVENTQCVKSVIWESLSQGTLGEGENLNYIVSGSDTIIVSTESSNGEIKKDTFLVNVDPPILEIPQPIHRIRKGETALLQVIFDQEDSVYWTPNPTLDNPLIGSPKASPTETTLYRAHVTNSLGCTSIGQVVVEVISNGYIPNLFTPNGDGRNDRLLIYDLDGVESFSFKIFNRVGNTVYFSSNVNEVKTTGWDGKWNSARQPSGVFYWSISGKYVDGTPIKLNDKEAGVIHLVR